MLQNIIGFKNKPVPVCFSLLIPTNQCQNSSCNYVPTPLD